MADPAPLCLSDPVAHTAKRLAAVLSGRVEPRGQSWRLRLVSRSPSFGGSLVFRADGKDGSTLAVKVHGQAQRALAEHAAAVAAGSWADVAAPVLVDASLKLSVSRWVEGQTLVVQLGHPGWEDALVQAGRWLRRFHRLPRPRVAWHKPGDALGQLRRLLASPGIQVPPSEVADFDRRVGHLERRAALTRAGPCRPVRLHGDFHYRNLIMSPDGPVGIDLGGTEVGSLHSDLARMTTHLAMLAETSPPSDAFDAERARSALLDGYGLRGRTARARLALCEAAELLIRWRMASRADRPQPHRSQAARAVLDKRGWVFAAAALLLEPGPLPAGLLEADRRSPSAQAQA